MYFLNMASVASDSRVSRLAARTTRIAVRRAGSTSARCGTLMIAPSSINRARRAAWMHPAHAKGQSKIQETSVAARTGGLVSIRSIVAAGGSAARPGSRGARPSVRIRTRQRWHRWTCPPRNAAVPPRPADWGAEYGAGQCAHRACGHQLSRPSRVHGSTYARIPRSAPSFRTPAARRASSDRSPTWL